MGLSCIFTRHAMSPTFCTRHDSKFELSGIAFNFLYANIIDSFDDLIIRYDAQYLLYK